MASLDEIQAAEDAEGQAIQAVGTKINALAAQLAAAEPGSDKSDAILTEIREHTAALMSLAADNNGGGGGIDLARPDDV